MDLDPLEYSNVEPAGIGGALRGLSASLRGGGGGGWLGWCVPPAAPPLIYSHV